MFISHKKKGKKKADSHFPPWEIMKNVHFQLKKVMIEFH